jgi:hypothetical protein
MITPLHIDGLVLWADTHRTHTHKPFLCWGDHGPYCAIRFEQLH